MVAHPGQLRLIFRAKQKNDRVAARKLATLRYLDQVPPVYVPTADVRGWRGLIEHRRRLIDRRTKTKNGLRVALRAAGLRPLKAGHWLWTRAGLAWLSTVKLPSCGEAVRRDALLSERGHFHLQIQRVTRELNRLPPGEIDPPKPPGAPPGSAARVQASACEPFRDLIVAKLDQGLSAKRIWQDLVRDHGFPAEYHSVRRFVRRLGQRCARPFRRMECEPGAEAQVDFGKGAPVVQADGKRRRPHAFRVILSHSRKAYSEVVWRQTTENFIRCLESAFRHFGGVPRTLVVDNLKAAVLKADWFDPDLNPKIQAFCTHYHTTILPTKPRMPRHKGKVESGVKHVQRNGLQGLTFDSLEAENRHLLQWETTVADTRIHGTTRHQVKKTFDEVEKPTLLPLPAERFPFFQEARRVVHRDGHVEVDKAYYSVPPEYLGREVWVRWGSHTVRVYDRRMQQMAMHLPQAPGRFSTQARHIVPEKISAVERGATWLLGKVRLIGPHRQICADGEKLIWRGGSRRLPHSISQARMVAPFLELCHKQGVRAKYCKQNLIETP